jgi:CRP-like cAMP-binding protein
MTFQFRPDILPHSGMLEQLPEATQKMSLPAGASIFCDNAVIFPLHGVLAVSVLHHEDHSHVAFAAKGDVVGIHALLAPSSPRFSATVISDGEFLSVPAQTLQSLMQKNEQFAQRLRHYAFRSFGIFLKEMAHRTSLAVEQRVAKWLSDYRRVAGSDTVAVTHQLMASSLQVRRSSVTDATHILEGLQLVRTRRACVEIIDPAGLQAFCKPRLR